MRNFVIAAVSSLLVALGVHAYDCYVGSRDQCLMSQGLLWVYWLGAFFVVGIPIAGIVASISRKRAGKPPDSAA